MYPYVICRCGRSLGDLYLLFRQLREDLVKKHMDKDLVDNLYYSISHGDKTVSDLRPIFEMLHLDLMCCRTTIDKQFMINDM